MAFVIADRVRETTSSSGTGTITLTGAFSGFQPFSTIGNGNNTYYCIIDSTNGTWEVGIGTYTTSGNTLSRDTVLSSSNSGSLVPFAVGLKDVICTQPSARAVYAVGTDVVAANNAKVPNSLLANSGITFGSTAQALGSTVTALNGVSIGGSTAAAGSFTTLTTSSTVTHNGGTANGVAYLNGSKVLTTGSALTFDGNNLSIGANGQVGSRLSVIANGAMASFNTGAAADGRIEYAYNGTSIFYTGVNSSSLMMLMARSGVELGFGANNSEQMRLTSTGLGIGTSSPTQKLEILTAVSASTPAAIFRSAAGVGNTGGLAFYANDTNANARNWYLVANSNSYGDFLIRVGASQGANPTAGNTVATFDSSGNLGLGVTPSAWASGFKAFQVAANTAVWGGTGTTGPSYFSNNVIFDGARKYINTAAASEYQQNSGSHLWLTAPSGTAGNAISFTQAMTLDASGRLGLGTSSPTRQFQVNNSSNAIISVVSVSTEGVFNAGPGIVNIGTVSAEPLSLSTGGTERARINSSGNLLVGTTSDIGGNGARAVFGNSSAGGADRWGAFFGTNTGSATAAPGFGLTIGWNYSAGGGESNIVFGTAAGGTPALAFSSSNGTTVTERARIDSSGNLLVGRTSAGLNKVVSNGGFQSEGTPQFNIYSTNSSTAFEWVLRTGSEMQFYVNNAAVLATLSSSGVWTNASDARYKENIRSVGYGLAEVMQLQPRAYNIIGSDKQEIGFVAQEVEPLIPELVDSTRNSVTEEDRLTLSYGQMSAVLVKAIQEQQAIIESLKARLDAANL